MHNYIVLGVVEVLGEVMVFLSMALIIFTGVYISKIT